MKEATLKHRFFNVNETVLYWKKMLSRTFIAGEEKSVPVVKASKLLLLGANAAGDIKLKPIFIYLSKNPS